MALIESIPDRGNAHKFGWLLLETTNSEWVWELPCGGIVRTPRNVRFHLSWPRHEPRPSIVFNQDDLRRRNTLSMLMAASAAIGLCLIRGRR